MKISLSKVPQKDKPKLAGMLLEYQKELFPENEVNEYKYLDSYWTEDSRTPFFIELNGEVVGFVLINKYTLVKKDAWSIAEFYIAKEKRRTGVGRTAVYKVFDMFPGDWEVREMENNKNAQNFWRKVISAYTGGEFSETNLNDKSWVGPIQTFNNLSKDYNIVRHLVKK